MDTNLEKMTFNKSALLKTALECCLSGGKKVSFCLDETGVLKGLLTEGDILRAFNNGAKITDPAFSYLNKTPIAVSDSVSICDAKKKLGSRIQVLPRIDSAGRLLEIIDMGTNEYGFLKIKSKTVTILGLGYVGLTMGLVLADTGFQVKGFDINLKLLKTLRSKKKPFFENGIEDFIEEHIGKRLRLVDDVSNAKADIYVITVGTPVDKQKHKPKLEAIRKAAKAIGSMLSRDNLVILRSTVMVGTTRDIVIPELEQESGLKAGEDFFVAFCPERTAEGRALTELRQLPQIVGGLDEKSTELATRLFNEYTPTVVRTESIEAAELCKLIDNCYRDVRFAFANQVAEIAERVGVNIHNIINAVNLNYARNSIPKPSPGVAGPCLIKDPYILGNVFEKFGMQANLLMAAREINEQGAVSPVLKVDNMLKKYSKTLKNARVFVVGFAFKGDPETSDLRDSTTLIFLDTLKEYTNNIVAYDPVAFSNELKALNVEVVSEPDEGFNQADAVFILNNHASYRKWNVDEMLKKMNHISVFYDGWNLFSDRNIESHNGIVYMSIGVGGKM